MSAPRVLVIGDAALDIYWVGGVHHASEGAAPILKHSRTVTFPGMALNVTSILRALGVDAQFCGDPDTHVALKNRLITESGQVVARWDVRDHCNPPSLEKLQKDLEDVAPHAIIVSDYNKGAVTPKIRETLLALDVPLFVDTKGDPFNWIRSGVTLFPNEIEYSEWQDHYDWMESVVLKRSSQGAQVMSYGGVSQDLPAFCHAPLNTCGAGDAFLAGWVASETLSAELPHNPLVAALSISGLYVSNPWDQRLLNVNQYTNQYTPPPSGSSNPGVPEPLHCNGAPVSRSISQADGFGAGTID